MLHVSEAECKAYTQNIIDSLLGFRPKREEIRRGWKQMHNGEKLKYIYAENNITVHNGEEQNKENIQINQDV
jgi:hypothetical protein